MKIHVLFVLLFSLSAQALDTQSRGGSFSLEDLSGALSGQTPLEPQVDCFDPAQTPACGQINRQYCNTLRSNQGRATDPTGNVNVGQSARSQMSELDRANLQDLTRMLPELPADLRREVERPVARVAELLRTENDSRNWYRDVARVREDIESKVRSVANRRADEALRSRLPRGQRATNLDKSNERDQQFRELMDTVARAKMVTSPTWPRMNNVFARVKEDMTAVINTLPLTPEEKQQRINRINSTNLTTPFGVRVGGGVGRIMESDCRTNMVNAMYMDLSNSLTVCAGLANGFQSENSIYFTLAHELAHSFNVKFMQEENSSPRFSTLNERLVETNGNMPCDEYARVDAASRLENNFNCGREEYNRFMNCVSGLDPQTIPPRPNRQFEMFQFFEQMNFCRILDRREGLAYMNPNEFADRNFGRMISSGLQEFTGSTPARARALIVPAYYITQEKRCNPTRSCVETSKVAELRMAFAAPAEACSIVAERGAENESDWYAQKAMIIRLRSMTDIRARRELVAGSMGIFCGYSYTRPLSERDQSALEKELEKMALEGGLSGEGDHHSSNEERISAIMTEDMASLLQCTNPQGTTPGTSNYQSCRL